MISIIINQTTEFIGIAIMVVYCVSLLIVTAYCLMQFHLLYYYKRFKKDMSQDKTIPLYEKENQYPFVTIQLPIYNELYVVERLLKSISQLDYPKKRFEIHVLDDSTDETRDIIAKEIEKYSNRGFNINHIHRDIRTGYKAGALKDAMAVAKGEFIAIFDADFLPYPSFLKKTLGYFIDDKTGVVQTRWEHLNEQYSLLTKVQAFQLNVHFTVEQLGRRAGNLFLQFNGTAGVWRRSCIEEAGGWEADTLTEDLDLSYRAQLKGWKVVYLEETTSPAELPSEMQGLKSQQFRWMKGGAETAKKVLPKVWRSDLSLRHKIHASAHLLGSSVFLAIFILGVFSVPLAYFINPMKIDTGKLTIFLLGFLSILIIYYVANVQVAWKKENTFKMAIKFFILFPIFLALSMGLSFHNSLAVLQGYLGKKTAFVRTPKFNIKSIGDQFLQKKYFESKINVINIWEGLLFFYFIAGAYYGLQSGHMDFFPMHVLLAVGYGLILFFSIKNWNLKR